MRNILLIVVDCLRADFVYSKGNAHTPAIDRLVETGFSFVNEVTNSTTTTPSFSSILTGLYPFEHGVRTHAGMKLNPDVVTLPEILKRAGYHTYAEVNGPLGVEVGLTRGFDEYRHRGRRQTIHTDWGNELIRNFKEKYRAPWFVLLHLWSLHRKRGVLPEREDPKYGATEYGRALSSIDLYLERLLPTLPPDTLVALTGDHGEEITYGYFDHEYKKWRRKLMKFLMKRKLLKKHVSHALRGCLDGHGAHIYDVLVKTPLTFHGARIPAGRSEKQVRHIDIAPTLLEAASAPPENSMRGRSLMPMINGAPGEHRDAYMEAAGTVMMTKNLWLAGMRVDNKYKLIRGQGGTPFAPELYDLQDDPDERRNIASFRPNIVADMAARIESLDINRDTGAAMSSDEEKVVLSRLKDLGYHD